MEKRENKLSIKEWAEADRPREKMSIKGAQALSDAELLAILIGSGNSEESAVQLSQRILHSVNNNLNLLGKRSVNELIAGFKGIGEAKAVTICAALELGKRRGAAASLERNRIESSRDAYMALHSELCDLPHEELWMILTNPACRILKKVKIGQGGINSSPADIRLIFKTALMETATGFILCHNHPSGNIKPSAQDNALTEQVKKAAKIMDITMLDHIILTDGAYYSYADEGKL